MKSWFAEDETYRLRQQLDAKKGTDLIQEVWEGLSRADEKNAIISVRQLNAAIGCLTAFRDMHAKLGFRVLTPTDYRL